MQEVREQRVKGEGGERLSMKEEQAIPELRRLKDKWKKLYEEGKEKDKYERRALPRQMNRIEGDIAKKDLELAKIDLGIRSVDKMDSILSKGKEIFKGEFWNKIEGTLTSEKLMDIMVVENSNEKRVLTKVGEIAKVSDKHVLDAIDRLPDEDVEAVWGKAIETEELDEILDKKIEAQKKSLEIERF